jgi:hypothetical protein
VLSIAQSVGHHVWAHFPDSPSTHYKLGHKRRTVWLQPSVAEKENLGSEYYSCEIIR